MRNGGVGTISATANVNPAAIYRLYAACSKPPRKAGEGAAGLSTDTKQHESGNELDLEEQQHRLNIVRDVFSRKYLMIAALKQGIAIYANDPAWAKVRPPLLELTADQAKTLAAELGAISFTMPGLTRGSTTARDGCEGHADDEET